MAGETDLHKLLKKEACRWLYRVGYRCIAAEVRLAGLGIIDSVGTGLFRGNHNYLFSPTPLHQTCFVECKASRADFLRDVSEDGQLQLAMIERERNNKRRGRARRKCLSQRVGLGKFDACLAMPMANLHYILAPAGMIQRKELPARWGLLSYGPGGISVAVRPDWQEPVASRASFVECAIARTLTMDIYRADDRAMASVNRAIMTQQAQLAERIRAMKIVLASPEESVDEDGAVALGADGGGGAVLAPLGAAEEEPVGRGIPQGKPGVGVLFRRNRVASR